MGDNNALGHIALLLKTLGIAYIFYLDYVTKIVLPKLAILLITLGSVGMSKVGHESNEDPIFNYHYHNAVLGGMGALLIFNKYLK
jgi:hypothetical protein